MRRIIIALSLLIIIVLGIIMIVPNQLQDIAYESDKIKITATLFPQYDFAKRIGGDKVSVKQLLPPGVESHTYEPSIQDILEISKADLFLYTGDEMEPWASKIASSISEDTRIENVSKGAYFINEEQFEQNHADDTLEEETHSHDHEHENDPHIWLNPENAIQMIQNIRDSLCEIDSKNTEYYTKNAQTYIEEIQELDQEITEYVKDKKDKKIVFGGAFAYAYFIEKYDIEYISAYDSCDAGIEPSSQKIKYIIDYMKQNHIKTIFYQDLENGAIAQTIAEETGAEMLVFNSIHNVSKDKLNAGISYLDLMKENFENLKKAFDR